MSEDILAKLASSLIWFRLEHRPSVSKKDFRKTMGHVFSSPMKKHAMYTSIYFSSS